MQNQFLRFYSLHPTLDLKKIAVITEGPTNFKNMLFFAYQVNSKI
jgi:hypothetical protein